MPKQNNPRARKKEFELPRLAVGDVLLVGKFKNRKATITGFSSDENNQPVAQTDKGEQKIFKPRIAKLMPAKQTVLTPVPGVAAIPRPGTSGSLALATVVQNKSA